MRVRRIIANGERERGSLRVSWIGESEIGRGALETRYAHLCSSDVGPWRGRGESERERGVGVGRERGMEGVRSCASDGER